jgi:hypothetical protein
MIGSAGIERTCSMKWARYRAICGSVGPECGEHDSHDVVDARGLAARALRELDENCRAMPMITASTINVSKSWIAKMPKPFTVYAG